MINGSFKAKTLLGAAGLELLIGIALAVTLFFGYFYVSANLRVFTVFSLLDYSQGWSRFWMALYLGSDAAFFLVVVLILIEIVLLILRTMVGIGVRTYGKWTEYRPDSLLQWVRKFSVLTIVRWLGISNRKRAIFAYLGLILVVFGPGWIGKTVLRSTDDLVYRTEELLHLENETHDVEFSSAIGSNVGYDFVIEANVGVVHLYTSKDTTQGNFHFLYDTPSQQAAFSMDTDSENRIITIRFGSEETYERYVDPVPSAVEIFLPDNLKVDSVSVVIRTAGFLTVEYVDFSDFTIDVTNTQVAFTAVAFPVGILELRAHGGQVQLRTEEIERLTLALTGTQATIEAGIITDWLRITAGETELSLNRTKAAEMDLSGTDSGLELREVYSPETTLTLNRCELLYYNNDADFEFSSFVLTQEASTISALGVPYDSDGND